MVTHRSTAADTTATKRHTRRVVVATGLGCLLPFGSARSQDFGMHKLDVSASELFEARPSLPTIGAQHPRLVVIEFLDYRCGFCRRMQPTIDRLLRENPDLAFAIEELPVFGSLSDYAAKAALVAFEHGRFSQVHNALLSKAILAETDVDDVMTAAGIEDLKQRIANASLRANLARAFGDAEHLRLTGTPAFVIGQKLVRGALSYEDLRDLIALERHRM